MNRRIFHPLGAVILVAAAACVASTGAGPGKTNPSPLAQRRWTPALKTIPTREDCKSAAPETRMSCYQIFLESVLKTEGIDSAMASLTQLAASEPVVRDNSHMFAHSL